MEARIFLEVTISKVYGLGNIFSVISKTVMPLIKIGAKAIGKQALKSGVGFASDVIKGKQR